MPILKPEPDIFPDSLFDVPVGSVPWWVAHLRSRQEKLAAREALVREIPFYLPQREQKVRRFGRVRLSYLPLFPGYLFFRGDLDIRAEVVRTNLCVRILEVVDQLALHQDLRQVFDLQSRGLPLVPYGSIAVGDAVRITEGPFAGYRGTLIHAKGHTRLVVSVRFINRAVSVELGRDVVAPVMTQEPSRPPASRG